MAQAEGRSSLVTRAAVIAGLSGLLFGFDTGAISGALHFVTDTFHLSTVGQETVVSMVLLGALFGGLVGGALTDKIGRRSTMILAGILFIFGALASSLAPQVDILDIARIVIGVAIGVSAVAAPLYIAEVSPADVRGRLVSTFQLFITIGILFAYFVDEVFSLSGDWRAMLAMGVVPAVVLLIGMKGLPDSPRYLIGKGRIEEARAVLKQMYGENSPEGEAELKGIHEIITTEKSSQWSELFSKELRWPFFIAMGLFVIQQFTGINTVIYYAPVIFQKAGFTSESAAIWATVSVGFINVLSTLIALWLIDKVGRKPLLYAGLAGMVVALFAIGVLLSPQFKGSAGGVTVAAVWIFVACFAFSLGPVPWLMIAEIFPLRVRGRAASVASTANWGCNLIVSFTFLTFLNKFGNEPTFWIYGTVGIIGMVFVWKVVPETKGRTLEAIEKSST